MMASVKIGTKQYNDIIEVYLNSSTDDKEALVTMRHVTGKLKSISFNKNNGIRVEAKGNIKVAKISNCVTVYGDVLKSSIINCLEVEGFVINYNNCRNKINVDKNIKVCYGKEQLLRSGMPLDSIKQQRVLHIDGHLDNLDVNISNVRIETVIWGNIADLNVGNCAYIKGTIHLADVGNNISCTFGKSEAPSINKIKQRKEYRNAQIKDMMGELFKDLNI